MTQHRQNMDWLLKDLVTSVPQIRHVVVLSADGLSIARLSTVQGPEGEEDITDRIAAACSGLQSLASAIAHEFPHGEGRMRLVVIEIDVGFFYLMAAAQGAYLAVMADDGVDAGLMGQRMRDLVARIGQHLSSAPRSGGPAV
jgi:predicted regulator of Ras-like GTPase activity (Roadblock/LC7/MglB family)